ncbi:MAG: phosphodiester glycosidase family protein [Vampirovibrionales bacterium]|nr:phosphodiester glycosidase family protein [Vampirovibrionales bacterium]
MASFKSSAFHRSLTGALKLSGDLCLLNLALVMLAIFSFIGFKLLANMTATASQLTETAVNITPPLGMSETSMPETATQEARLLTLRVKKVQFEKAFAGEKIILTLANRLPAGASIGFEDSLPSDFNFSDTDPDKLTMSFSGSVDGLDKPLIRNFSTPNLKQVYLESHLGKVQLFAKRMRPKSAKFNWDEKNNQLVIQIQNYGGWQVSNMHVADGLDYREVFQQMPKGPVRFHVVEIDPARYEIFPVLAKGRMGAKATVRQMVSATGASVGINASFFKQDKGIALGTVILDDELVAGPIFDRVCFGIDGNNQAQMARLSFHGELSFEELGLSAPSAETGRGAFTIAGIPLPATLQAAGQKPTSATRQHKLAIHNINQPRVHSTQTVMYSERWGSVAPAVPKGGAQALLTPFSNPTSGQKEFRLAAVSTTQALAIPKGGLVISGPMNAQMSRLVTLPNGTAIHSRFYTTPDWSGIKHAISGGPYLVRDGERYVDLKKQQFYHGLGAYEPRTAIGVKADGTLLLVTVDGRQSASVGMTLWEMSYLMEALGAKQAMNLDGGSSSQMVIGDRFMNRPTSPNGVPVSTALVVRPIDQAPVANSLKHKLHIAEGEARKHDSLRD